MSQLEEDEMRDSYPPSPRIVRRRNLVDEAVRLAAHVRNGYMRKQSQAYKRQWLMRVCDTLEALAAEVAGRLPKENYKNMMDRIQQRTLRERELAAARGEPVEEWIGRSVSPTKE